MSIAEVLRSRGEPMSDAEIVRRVVGGEKQLFEILMRRHNQRMYRTVRAILGTEDEVEDAMQQAWVNAFQHLGQFADRALFSTWLTRIAVNEAILRTKKRERRFPVAAEGETMAEVESSGPDPEQQAVVSQLRGVMEREVAALPETYRSVFILRDVEGLSTQETAECLSLNEDAVKTRLHRARTMLRDNLYDRAGVTVSTLFTFGNARCDRVVAAVMATL